MTEATLRPREGWQRARNPGEKAIRRSAILNAARDMLDQVGLEGTTLSEIARASGVSKASCYRYFESREAILLEIAVEEVGAWADDVNVRLGPLVGSRNLYAVAEAYARAAALRPRFCMLSSVLSSVLERNVSVETITQFKRSFNAPAFSTTTHVVAAIPELTPSQMELFMRFLYTAIAGAWPSANSAPAVKEAMRSEEFDAVRGDFESAIRDYTRLVLAGFLWESKVAEHAKDQGPSAMKPS